MTKKVVSLEKLAELLNLDISNLHRQLAIISSSLKTEYKR
jgi:hypothetical protein